MIGRSFVLVSLSMAAWLCSSAPPYAQSMADAPVTIMLVLDGSDQTVQRCFWINYADARSRLARLIEREFLGRLGPNDRVRVSTVGPRPVLSSRYTSDLKESAASVRAALLRPSKESQSGGLPVWDAVGQAVSALAAEPGRRVIVLLSDGEATANTRTSAEVALEAASASIAIHVVSTAFDTTIPQGHGAFIHSRPSQKLRELAEISGGLFLQTPEAVREYRPHLAFESFDSYAASRTHMSPPSWDRDPGKAFAKIAAALR